MATNLATFSIKPADRTQNSLDIFNGQDALGKWQLFNEDDGCHDSALKFVEATLYVKTVSVPEPSSTAQPTPITLKIPIARLNRSGLLSM